MGESTAFFRTKAGRTIFGIDVAHGGLNLNRQRGSSPAVRTDKNNPPHCERTEFRVAWRCRSDSNHVSMNGTRTASNYVPDR